MEGFVSEGISWPSDIVAKILSKGLKRTLSTGRDSDTRGESLFLFDRAESQPAQQMAMHSSSPSLSLVHTTISLHKIIPDNTLKPAQNKTRTSTGRQAGSSFGSPDQGALG